MSNSTAETENGTPNRPDLCPTASDRKPRGASDQPKGQPVDMIALAREATRRDIDRAQKGGVKLIAPAKVNLFLAIGQRRDDGYHDVDNIMHAVMLHDVLYMGLAPAESADAPLSVQVTCTGCEGIEVPDIPPEENIAHRAVTRLAQALGRGTGEVASVHIEKHIPHQAGLGGGSSDAAAALLGAAQLWGVPADHPEVERAAHGLGSDVAFFLHGGCARFSGAGERFEAGLSARHENIVLIKPQPGLSTAKVYKAFDEDPCPVDAAQLSCALAARDAGSVPLANNLAPAAERLAGELADIRAWAAAQPGAGEALLCGSGSASFVLCDDFNAACKIAAAAKRQGWWARTTAFGPVRAGVIPA